MVYQFIKDLKPKSFDKLDLNNKHYKLILKNNIYMDKFYEILFILMCCLFLNLTIFCYFLNIFKVDKLILIIK